MATRAIPDWRTYQPRFADPALASGLAISVREELHGNDAVGSRLDIERAADAFACQTLPFANVSTLSDKHDASLLPRTVGRHRFVLRYHPLHHWVRRRFSFAHEFGHTFFYDKSQPTPQRLRPAPDEAEERFCDLFAAELLLPGANIPSGATPGDLRALAKRFAVSTQVVARQIHYHKKLNWKAIVGLRWAARPAEPTNFGLRIDWYVAADRVFVPHLAKCRSGPALEAYRAQSAVVRTERLDAGGLRGEFEQHAVPIGQTTVVLAVR